VCVHITQSRFKTIAVFLILKTIAAAGKTNQHKIIAATVKAIQQGQSNKISNSAGKAIHHKIIAAAGKEIQQGQSSKINNSASKPIQQATGI